MNSSDLENIKGIIFDLDDTLYNAQDAYAKALDALKLSPEDPRYLDARKSVKSCLPDKHVSARNRLLYFKRLCENSNQGSPAKILETMEIYENALREEIQRQWQELNRGPLLSWLKSRFKLIILTNENTRTQLLKMSVIDPHSEYFSSILTSEEMGFEKPDPRAFQIALEALELEACECLMIGDSLKNDIWPALNSGIYAVWSGEFTKESLGKRNKRFLSLDR